MKKWLCSLVQVVELKHIKNEHILSNYDEKSMDNEWTCSTYTYRRYFS